MHLLVRYKGRTEYLGQGMYDPQSLADLSSGPLEKWFVDSWLKQGKYDVICTLMII